MNNAYADYFMTKANAQSDPLERIKFLGAFAVSKLHLTLTMQKPFNPVLGETFQCTIGNAEYYLEQTSHHPPVYNFYVTYRYLLKGKKP